MAQLWRAGGTIGVKGAATAALIGRRQLAHFIHDRIVVARLARFPFAKFECGPLREASLSGRSNLSEIWKAFFFNPATMLRVAAPLDGARRSGYPLPLLRVRNAAHEMTGPR
jgi:hypothetical protein